MKRLETGEKKMMISNKLYRWVQVHVRGRRSFTKESREGTKTYLVIGGNTGDLADTLKDMGYEEEWPLGGGQIW